MFLVLHSAYCYIFQISGLKTVIAIGIFIRPVSRYRGNLLLQTFKNGFPKYVMHCRLINLCQQEQRQNVFFHIWHRPWGIESGKAMLYLFFVPFFMYLLTPNSASDLSLVISYYNIIHYIHIVYIQHVIRNCLL